MAFWLYIESTGSPELIGQMSSLQAAWDRVFKDIEASFEYCGPDYGEIHPSEYVHVKTWEETRKHEYAFVDMPAFAKPAGEPTFISCSPTDVCFVHRGEWHGWNLTWSRDNHIEFDDPRTRVAVRALALTGRLIAWRRI